MKVSPHCETEPAQAPSSAGRARGLASAGMANVQATKTPQNTKWPRRRMTGPSHPPILYINLVSLQATFGPHEGSRGGGRFIRGSARLPPFAFCARRCARLRCGAVLSHGMHHEQPQLFRACLLACAQVKRALGASTKSSLCERPVGLPRLPYLGQRGFRFPVTHTESTGRLLGLDLRTIRGRPSSGGALQLRCRRPKSAQCTNRV